MLYASDETVCFRAHGTSIVLADRTKCQAKQFLDVDRSHQCPVLVQHCLLYRLLVFRSKCGSGPRFNLPSYNPIMLDIRCVAKEVSDQASVSSQHESL